MLKLSSAFPPDWPDERATRFADAIARHWPSAELAARPFDGPLERARFSVPAALAGSAADGDIVAWLDPDVEPFASVPSFVVPHLIKDADACFAASDESGIDLSFWAVRLSEASRRFLTALLDGGDNLPSTTWLTAQDSSGVRVRDLAPGGFAGVWAHGPLGRYTRRMA